MKRRSFLKSIAYTGAAGLILPRTRLFGAEARVVERHLLEQGPGRVAHPLQPPGIKAQAVARAGGVIFVQENPSADLQMPAPFAPRLRFMFRLLAVA